MAFSNSCTGTKKAHFPSDAFLPIIFSTVLEYTHEFIARFCSLSEIAFNNYIVTTTVTISRVNTYGQYYIYKPTNTLTELFNGRHDGQ